MGLALETSRLGDAAAGFDAASEYAAVGLARLGGTAISGAAFGGVPSGSALAAALMTFSGQHQASLSAATQALQSASSRVSAVIGLAHQTADATAAAAAAG